MPKLLVLDIDGTLLDPSDIVTPVVHEAIAASRAVGVEVALATGRRLRSVRSIVEEVGIHLPLVLSNGALVWSTEREEAMNEVAFTPEWLTPLIELAMRHDLAPILLTGPGDGEGVVVLEDSPQRSLVDGFLNRITGTAQFAATDRMGHTPHVLTVDIFGPEDELRHLTDQLTGLGYSVFHSGPLGWEADPPHWAANIHMPGVSKASGVALLAADLGLTMADVVAVGDGENDMPLLEAAGIGVAMGNAPEHVRARADQVVRGHDEDGVAEAIERFVLGNAR